MEVGNRWSNAAESGIGPDTWLGSVHLDEWDRVGGKRLEIHFDGSVSYTHLTLPTKRIV